MSQLIRFGNFLADLRSSELFQDGLRIELQQQPFLVLARLLERPGELVTREDLRQALWPRETFVDYGHGINKAVNKIRRALGDSADRPQYVETLRKRGYRLIVPAFRSAHEPPKVEGQYQGIESLTAAGIPDADSAQGLGFWWRIFNIAAARILRTR